MSMMKTGVLSIERGALSDARPVLWPCPPAPRSRIDLLAGHASGLSARRRDILGHLIAASLPLPATRCAALDAIWINEMFERIGGQAQMLAALDARLRSRRADALPVPIERDVTARLAASLRLIGESAACPLQPCSDPLRSVVRDAVELFGGSVGDVVVRTEVERVALSATQRRALVLAAYHLVADALRDGFGQRRCGAIAVTLRRHGPVRLILSVSDDGDGRIAERMAGRGDAFGDLAAILDGAVACRRGRAGGLQVDLLLTLPNWEPSP